MYPLLRSFTVHLRTLCLSPVTCQLIALHDGTAYNSVEIVWNAEPKNLVYMSPYILAFTANTVEIRMASNASLMQTIQVPDLHLISMKVKIVYMYTDAFFLSLFAQIQIKFKKSLIDSCI